MTQVILQLVFISLLARLISEEAFGVMAIALVVVGFIEIFSQIGIGPALIQRKELTDEHINGAFLISVFLGVVFTLLLYFIAPLVAKFYDHEPLTLVLRVIGLSFFISAIAIVPKSLIIKEMAFKKLFIAALIAMSVGNIGVGLFLAFSGYDLWAYVIALLSQNVLMTIAYWYFHPIKVSLKWSWAATGDMIRYGGGSTLFNMFNYAATKIDTLIVGKFGGMHSDLMAENNWKNTGIYDRAVYLMGLPITVLGKLSDSVMFSGLALLQDDQPRLQRAFYSAFYHIALLVIPGSVFMIFYADEITVLFLGPKYSDAVPIVQILFISVAFRSLIKIGDSVVRALDAVYLGSAIKAFFFLMVGAGTYFGLQFGLQGVAWFLVLSTAIQFFLMTGLSIRLTGTHGAVTIKKTIPAILVGGFVALTCWGTSSISLALELPRWLSLLVGVLVNGVALISLALAVPWMFKQGKDNVLATIASKIPVGIFRNRWL